MVMKLKLFNCYEATLIFAVVNADQLLNIFLGAV